MGIATLPTVVAVGGAFVAYAAYSAIVSLRANIEAAKRSGLPYIISPLSPIWLPAQITHKLWMPVVRTCLPKSWWENWIIFLTQDWSYIHNHAIFALHGPAFFVVSPYSTMLLTSSAELIRQIAHRREHFPKFVETYEILTQFGDNTLTTEGALWRVHRRATAASFNERNAALVFAVAIEQTQGLVEKWMADQAGGGESKPVDTIDSDTMRLALNIIGYVGFGLRLLWPGQRLPEGVDGERLEKYSGLEPVGRHSMSFVETIAVVLERILLLLVVPEGVLRYLPFKQAKEAAEAYQNYVQYMEELLEEKLQDMRKGSVDAEEPGMDIMGQLVRSTYGDGVKSTTPINGTTNGSLLNGNKLHNDVEKTGKLNKSDILGNAFIMLVAGHETTANALHFTFIELATNPSAQRALQRDVDALLGRDTDPRTWSYEGSVGPLLASMVGACMNETLRKWPSVVEVPKKVAGGGDQVVSLDGRSVVLPEGAAISLVAVAAHRNPRYWPTRRSRVTGKETDLDDYVPERWFRKCAGGEEEEEKEGKLETSTPSSATTESYEEGENEEDFGGYKGPDTSGELFRPERGAYIPFSDGARSCLGRRIAQVEIVAALAVIFQKYSLELAVDDFVGKMSDVEKMGREERERVYRLAQERCRKRMSEATSVLTLKMQPGEDVPVRLVRRGEEKFVSWIE